jgi:pyridoxine 5-phosphate synthase
VPLLAPSIQRLTRAGIRVSLFVDCDPAQVRALAPSGAQRVELYTGPYAQAWGTTQQAERTREVWASAQAAAELGLGLNAGHDLDRHNLAGLHGLPGLSEVSIGHAQICRALEVGTAQSVRELLTALAGKPC